MRWAIAGALALVVPLSAQGQPTPSGPLFQVNAYTTGSQFGPAVATDAAGNVLVAWTSGGLFPGPNPEQDGSEWGVFARRFDAGGNPLGGEFQVNATTAGFQRSPAAAAGPGGTFLVVWNSEDGIHGQRYAAGGAPQGGEFRVDDSEGTTFRPAIGAGAAGDFVVAWTEYEDYTYPPSASVKIRRLDAGGAPLAGEEAVAGVPFAAFPSNSLAVHPDGAFVVVWQSYLSAYESSRDLLARRFTGDGTPLGDTIAVTQTTAFRTDAPRAATLPGGGFVVVWQDDDFLARNLEIVARRFAPDGEPLGDEFVVNSLPEGDDRSPTLAVDADGDLVVAWAKEVPVLGEGGEVVDRRISVFARRFGADGRPQGKEFRLDSLASPAPTSPSLAADPGGSFVAVWELGRYDGTGPDGDAIGIFGQRFLVPPPGGDLCRLLGSTLACDVDRDGQAEVHLPMPLRPGDVPLLGDLDGDGRGDPCVVRGGRFLCHTEGDGSPAEIVIRFDAETAGAVPLLGDPNGDGRDDPCWFGFGAAGPTLACDSAHDGTFGEVKVRLNPSLGGVPLLGDLDGDGDDEACLYRERAFLCDAAHDGGGAELAIRFGDGTAAGDVALLGDLDGDGRDDPCVLRAGRLLCDTAHDGGTAEIDLPAPAGDGPVLLGNVDGI